MAVPNGAKRRPMNDKTKSKRFKPNGKQNQHGGYGPSGRYGPPAMLRDAFGPGPFPSMRPPPGHRFPPGPMFRGGFPPNFMPPGPQFPPRLRGPPLRPGIPPIPPFMHRPPFPRPPYVRPLLPNPNLRPRNFTRNNTQNKPPLNRNTIVRKTVNKSPDELNDMSKPWITDEIRAENTKRLQLVKTARQSKNDKDWEAFKVQRMKLHAMVKEAKEKYLSRNPQEVRSEAFQINPDSTSKGVDFTEDLKF